MEETQVDGTSEEIKDPAAVLAALDRAKKDAKQFREEKEALELEITKFKDESAKFSSQLLKEKVIQELSIFDPPLLVAGKADSAENTPVNNKLSASQRQAMLVLGR